MHGRWTRNKGTGHRGHNVHSACVRWHNRGVKGQRSWHSRHAGAGHCRVNGEEFALGIDPKSLHTMVLMQMVYSAVVWHSRGFLKHVVISVTEKSKDNGGID